MKLDDITYDAENLWEASEQRQISAWTLLKAGDWAGAMYLGGLSVECIIQAMAVQSGYAPDAWHDLNLWLLKCPARFIDSVKSGETAHHWSRLVADWDNRLRYVGWSGLLGYVRTRKAWRRLKGNDRDRMTQFVKDFLHSSQVIQLKGIAQWQLSNK